MGAVGVGTGIGHGKDTGALVTELEVLVGKLFAVNGTTTGTVVTGEITSLAHEIRDDTVERGILEGQVGSLFAGAQGAEVFGGAGTTSARNSMTMRPRAAPSATISKKTRGLAILGM